MGRLEKLFFVWGCAYLATVTRVLSVSDEQYVQGQYDVSQNASALEATDEVTNQGLPASRSVQKRHGPSQIAILEAKVSAMETQLATVNKLIALNTNAAALDLKTVQAELEEFKNNHTENEKKTTARLQVQETLTTSLAKSSKEHAENDKKFQGRLQVQATLTTSLAKSSKEHAENEKKFQGKLQVQETLTTSLAKRSKEHAENDKKFQGRLQVQETLTTSLAKSSKEHAENDKKFQGRLQVQETLTTSLAKSSKEHAEQDEKLKARVTVEEARTASLEHRMKKAEERRTAVSFQAVHYSHQTVSSSGVVRFTLLRHSAGGTGYSTSTSKFRCPTTGVYAFAFGTSTSRCGNYRFAIVKDGRVITETWSYSSSGGCARVMSAFAVTSCSQGQYVYVKEGHGVTSTIYAAMTAFSGFKID